MLIDHVIGGKYRITELIGQGGMGTVFEAVHTGTGSRVAIKLIVSSDIKEEIFVRFQREARAAGTIDSQHIVRVFDMGTDERSGSPYMVMERLFGEDVSQLMRRVGPLSPNVAVTLAAQSALGLAKAHASGVVHRDIKPANLFLHDGGDSREIVVKILDFGIAKVLMDAMQKSEEGGLTRTGSMLGSPHYMSPEQAQGLRSIDHRSDIWSLGVVLYKMLSGQTPHAHLQTLGQVILAICSHRTRPIEDLAPWVPPEVARIVERCLQPDPNLRFQTANDLFAALQSVGQGLPALRRAEIVPLDESQRMRILPQPVPFRPDVPTNGTQHAMTQSPVPAAAPAKSNLPVLLGAAALMAAVGLAGIGAAVVAKKKHPPVTVATPSPVASSGTPSVVRERTVSLQIGPPGALVEVDGQTRELTGDAVEITGAPGSVVSVHVSAGGAETTQNVAITEGGAVPPKLTVTPVAIAAPTATTARTARPHTAAAAIKPAPSAAGTALNAQRTFE